MVKLLALITTTGYFVWYPDHIFTGPSHDAVISDTAGVEQFLEANGIACLADGVFTLSENILTLVDAPNCKR